MRIQRLPVAPRPYRDELSTSWLSRVACRYGLEADELARHIVNDAKTALPWPISATAWAWTPDQTRLWAQACGLDPMRVQRLSLAQRYPRRALTWFTNEVPDEWWPPAVGRSVPVCLACFDADHAADRDAYLRAHWALAEHCVCPMHRCALYDRCPHCYRRLHLVFRLREGRGRAVCGQCGRLLANRVGEDERRPDLLSKIQRQIRASGDAILVSTTLTIQTRVSAIVEGDAERRRRLERALAMLWAPLLHPAATRPVLARWLDMPGRRCASEARPVVGAKAPLGRLPMRWRVVTLIAMGNLFGIDLHMDPWPAAANQLFRQAAPRRSPLAAQSRRVTPGSGVAKRSSVDYLHLAQALLAHPDWIAAAGLPERARQRVQARLIDAALAKTAPWPAVGVAPGSFVQ